MDMREAFEDWFANSRFVNAKISTREAMFNAWQAALSHIGDGSKAEPVGDCATCEGEFPDSCSECSYSDEETHPAPTAQDSILEGNQGEKLKLLQARAGFRRQRWEEVAKLDFADGRSCYVDAFGRVLWLDGNDSKAPEGLARFDVEMEYNPSTSAYEPVEVPSIVGGYVRYEDLLSAAPVPDKPQWEAELDAYDPAIHSNTDQYAWADFFLRTFPNCGADRDTMAGWFANAMMAKADSLQRPEAPEEP